MLAYVAKRRGMQSLPYAPAIALGYAVTMVIVWASPTNNGLWQWITGGAS